MSAFTHETVLSVHHWTDTLFSFTATRSPSFRFLNGQFVMMGLEIDNRPLVRAYSMVNSCYEDALEFLSIKVPDGPLTSRLQHVKAGDQILVSKKPTGTLIQQSLRPGRNLYLLSTGTGLAPFMSIIRDPDVYDAYEKVILAHGCRRIAELAYGERITKDLPADEYLGAAIAEKLIYYPTVTREPFRNRGRVTDLVSSNRLFDDLGLTPLTLEDDRIMMCGNPDLIRDMTALLQQKGFREGSSGAPAEFVIEKAFVEK